MSDKDIGQMDEKEIPGKIEYCDGRLMKVLRAHRYGWARFYQSLEDAERGRLARNEAEIRQTER